VLPIQRFASSFSSFRHVTMYNLIASHNLAILTFVQSVKKNYGQTACYPLLFLLVTYGAA
jgi:hypothetical protein